MNKILFFMGMIVLIPNLCAAKDDSDTIMSGFSAYKTSGVKSALERWLMGSSLDGGHALTEQAISLSKVTEPLGKFQGYDIIKIVKITDKSDLVYAAANYEKGFIILTFARYKKLTGQSIIQSISYSGDASKLPFINSMSEK